MIIYYLWLNKGQIGNLYYKFNYKDSKVNHIEIAGNEDSVLQDVQIPDELLDFNVPIKIGSYIESLVLTDSAPIKWPCSHNLAYIKLQENSDRYILEDNYLYEKTKSGEKGDMILWLRPGQIDDIYYECNYKNSKLDSIKISTYNYKENIIKIPERLLSLNVPILIGPGITSLELTGDEIIKESYAHSLEYINIEDSNKYILENNILYEKSGSGEKKKILELSTSGNVGYVGYEYHYRDSKLDYIDIYSYYELVNVKIPKKLSNFKVPIKIGRNIKSLVLTGDEIIDISDATKLKSIDAINSTKYIVENGILYEKTESGEKGKQIAKIGDIVEGKG